MGTDGHGGGEVFRLVYDAWVGGPGGDRAKSLAGRVPVPGAVGLRGRFHLLTDPAVPALPGAQFQVTWEVWQRQVALTDAADAALVANDSAAADGALTALRATHQDGLHPLPQVDALVGLVEQLPAAAAVTDAQLAAHVLATASNLPLDGGDLPAAAAAAAAEPGSSDGSRCAAACRRRPNGRSPTSPPRCTARSRPTTRARYCTAPQRTRTCCW